MEGGDPARPRPVTQRKKTTQGEQILPRLLRFDALNALGPVRCMKLTTPECVFLSVGIERTPPSLSKRDAVSEGDASVQGTLFHGLTEQSLGPVSRNCGETATTTWVNYLLYVLVAKEQFVIDRSRDVYQHCLLVLIEPPRRLAFSALSEVESVVSKPLAVGSLLMEAARRTPHNRKVEEEVSGSRRVPHAFSTPCAAVSGAFARSRGEVHSLPRRRQAPTERARLEQPSVRRGTNFSRQRKFGVETTQLFHFAGALSTRELRLSKSD